MDCKVNDCVKKNMKSPEGLGICVYCVTPNTKCVGTDGKMWVSKDGVWKHSECQQKINDLEKKINADFKKLKLKNTKITIQKSNLLGLEDLLYDKKHYNKDGKISKSGLKHILEYQGLIVINAETTLDKNLIFNEITKILNKYELNKCLKFDGSDMGFKRVGEKFTPIGYSYFYFLL